MRFSKVFFALALPLIAQEQSKPKVPVITPELKWKWRAIVAEAALAQTKADAAIALMNETRTSLIKICSDQGLALAATPQGELDDCKEKPKPVEPVK